VDAVNQDIEEGGEVDGDSGDEEDGGPASAEQVVQELKELLDAEIEPHRRSSKNLKPQAVNFKAALYSRILEVEAPESSQILYAMVWFVANVLTLHRVSSYANAGASWLLWRWREDSQR
jgi:hypothetical protein